MLLETIVLLQAKCTLFLTHYICFVSPEMGWKCLSHETDSVNNVPLNLMVVKNTSSGQLVYYHCVKKYKKILYLVKKKITREITQQYKQETAEAAKAVDGDVQ